MKNKNNKKKIVDKEKKDEFFAFDMADQSHQKIKNHPDQQNPMELLREITESDEY